jgi:hypothetical protein
MIAIQVTSSERTAYSSSIKSPYVFNNGVMNAIINPVVQSWFQQQLSSSAASSVSAQLSTEFSMISLTVPSRFALSVDGSANKNELLRAVASRGGLPVASVQDIIVCFGCFFLF